MYKCPKCGQTGQFETQATVNISLSLVNGRYIATIVPMTDRYRMDNEMMCLLCRWQGTLSNFYWKDDDEEKSKVEIAAANASLG